MHLNLRLRFLKALVNVPMRILDKLVSFPRSVEAPQTDCVQGTFGCAPDGNFKRLLRVSMKVLAWISEDDNYYRAWLGLAFLLAKEQTDKFEETVSAGEIKHFIKMLWMADVDFLDEQFVEFDRLYFLEFSLASHLVNLSRMKCSMPALQRTKKIGGKIES